MKKLVLLMSIVVLAFIFTACGGSDSDSNKKAEAGTKATSTKTDKKNNKESEKETVNPTRAELSYATVNAPAGWEIIETTINMANLKQVDGTATMKVWCSAFTSAEEFVDGDITGFKEKENVNLKKITLTLDDFIFYGYHPYNNEDEFVLATDAKKGYVEIDGKGITIDEATGFIKSVQVVRKEKRY